MIEEFSSGPVIEQDLYEFINKSLYSGENVPVMMRVGLDADETFKALGEKFGGYYG